MSVEFPKFDLCSWKINTTSVILSDYGDLCADNLCLQLIEEYKKNYKFPNITITFSPIMHYDTTYRYDEYTTAMLSKIIERQILLHGRKEQNGIYPSVLVIIDDKYFNVDNFHRDLHMREVIFNGRHYNITTIIKMSYTNHHGEIILKSIPPSIRTNFGFVFVCPPHSYEDQIIHLLNRMFFLSRSHDQFMEICKSVNSQAFVKNIKDEIFVL